MQIEVNNTLSGGGLRVGVVVADAVRVAPASPELESDLTRLIEQRKGEEFPPPEVKDAVRNLLKTGGFKPSGRNKPASEYLAQAAREGRFPTINNLVDINNLVSLQSGLPISLLNAEAVGPILTLRFGRDGEKYVFNSVGQEIDLEGLICTCAGTTDTPLGNPVKDSIAGKINDQTTKVVGIIYSPAGDRFDALLKERVRSFADLLQRETKSDGVLTIIS